ncbi:MAG: AMP-binding protein, partial [Clostridia bacterium]|nr:AMP-binding protein [Clostridia bacterium]
RIMANIKEKGKEDLVNRMIKVSNGLRRVGIDQREKFFSEIRAAFGGELRTVITGGAPINPQILAFFDAIGISTLNGYGITECAPLISVNHSRNIVPGSVGTVLDMDTVRIDEPNEDGEGEILVKGPNVMLGYYRDEQATADAFDRGYFRTGDYGKLDKNNVLTITGRKKNLIILSNGKNVYPEEIENELAATPGILDIVVYEGQSKRGVSHNAIVAEVYPDRDYFEKNGITDIEAYLKPYVDAFNRRTVPYKKIAILKIRRTEFPKNTLRKIMRFQIDMTID